MSKDDGKTWSPRKVLEGNPHGWYCYISVLEHQGNLFLSYCAEKMLCHSRVTIVPVSWLYEPAPEIPPGFVEPDAKPSVFAGKPEGGFTELSTGIGVWKAADGHAALEKFVRGTPQFAAGAEVKVASRKNDKGETFLDVTFPAAETRNKCRVFEYEVTATLIEDDVDLVQAQRRVLAPDFHLPETPNGLPGRCTFAAGELPLKGHYRFSVRPIECFGLKGKAIDTLASV